MKKCTKCGETFPATTEYFYKDIRVPSGLQSWCKKCLSSYNKERHQEKVREAKKVKERIIEAGPSEVPKFTIGQGVKVGNKYGRVYKIFKHFVVVDFKTYKESINYKDIRLGQEQIKIGGKSC